MLQQPEAVTVSPPPPPAPPAPPPPSGSPAQAPVSVTVGDLELPLQGLPRTAQELQGLRERREILRDQLERATNRRDELLQEMRAGQEGERPLSEEARVGLQQRLQVIDERIVQLERDQALTERLISNASPELLAAARAEQRQQGTMIPEDDAVAISMTTFAGGVLLTLVVGRVRGWFRRRRGGVAPAAVVAEDPRIDRLAHAVDAIAEEVERIGEGQRFVTQLLAQQRESAAIGGRVERG